MANENLVLPADVTLRNSGVTGATALTAEQLRANGANSIVLPADTSLLHPTPGPTALNPALALTPQATTGAKAPQPAPRASIVPKKR